MRNKVRLASATISTDFQPFKYNGKELDRSFGLDWYDYGARWLDGVGGRWSSMDPLCEKYYDVSPYAYCAGNPVNRVDPDGRDIWEFDKYGNLNRTHNNKMDKLIVYNKTNWRNAIDYDDEGFAKWELVLPYGTINLEDKYNQKENLLVLSVNGTKNGKSVFEFLSKACDVEWGHAKSDISNSFINYVTTSHEITREGALGNFLYENPFLLASVYEINHSHPNNSTFPSKSDEKFAKWVNSFTDELPIWTKHLIETKTNIYTPTINNYFPF